MEDFVIIQSNELFATVKGYVQELGIPFGKFIIFLLVISLGTSLLYKSIAVVFGALGDAWRELVEQIKSSISR